MATKPTETFEWSTATNHATGPYSGSATKVDPPGHPTNPTGFTPGTGIIPEYINRLLNILGQWTGWLGSGSSAGAADAHVVETDGSGNSALRGLILQAGKLVGVGGLLKKYVDDGTDDGPHVRERYVTYDNSAGGAATYTADTVTLNSIDAIAFHVTVMAKTSTNGRLLWSGTAYARTSGSGVAIIDAGTPWITPIGAISFSISAPGGNDVDLEVTPPANSFVEVFIREERAAP